MKNSWGKGREKLHKLVERQHQWSYLRQVAKDETKAMMFVTIVTISIIGPKSAKRGEKTSIIIIIIIIKYDWKWP